LGKLAKLYLINVQSLAVAKLWVLVYVKVAGLNTVQVKPRLSILENLLIIFQDI